MPKRSSKRKPPSRDENQMAHDAVQQIIALLEESPAQPAKKNPAAVALGRLGGLKGGKARAEMLTAQQRSNIAKAAAATRWKSKP